MARAFDRSSAPGRNPIRGPRPPPLPARGQRSRLARPRHSNRDTIQKAKLCIGRRNVDCSPSRTNVAMSEGDPPALTPVTLVRFASCAQRGRQQAGLG